MLIRPLHPVPSLRFHCGECGHELETPVTFAGITAPCPMCGSPVQAPSGAEPQEGRREVGKKGPEYPLGGFASACLPAISSAPEVAPSPSTPRGLHLPPLNEETGLVEFPSDFWQEAQPSLAVVETDEAPDCLASSVPLTPPVPSNLSPNAIIPSEISPARLPPAREKAPMTRDEEEAVVVAGQRRKEFRLRFFDAALILLSLGTLAMGGAAVAFTQSKKTATPPPPPELSHLVVERMQRLDRARDEAVVEARKTVAHWITGASPAAVEQWCLAGDPVPATPGAAEDAPPDFEFIQARRLPGTERFLTLFEVLVDPPVVVPVEQTPAGPRLHGRAIAQQQGGLLAKFLASQGQGEAVFYAMVRPGPAPMREELVRTRPDLAKFIFVGVEPAFPADGATGCLACLAPGSPAAAIFAKRSHDPGLRPAVIKLAWRQHREAGNYVELAAFEPNAWSRH